MPEVKFSDIQVGQVYVTKGGEVVLDASGKTAGWGYDRVRVINKNSRKLVIETSWGTSCVLPADYVLSSTYETVPRTEFKLVAKYVSKREISFDDSLAMGHCAENIPASEVTADSLQDVLVTYFSTPQSIASAAKKFGESYHRMRYLIDKMGRSDKFMILRNHFSEGNTIQIQILSKGK